MNNSLQEDKCRLFQLSETSQSILTVFQHMAASNRKWFPGAVSSVSDVVFDRFRLFETGPVECSQLKTPATIGKLLPAGYRPEESAWNRLVQNQKVGMHRKIKSKHREPLRNTISIMKPPRWQNVEHDLVDLIRRNCATYDPVTDGHGFRLFEASAVNSRQIIGGRGKPQVIFSERFL